MDSSDLTLDQILSIGGLGSGPYGGGDVVRWSPDGRELLVAAALGGWRGPRRSPTPASPPDLSGSGLIPGSR